MLNLIQTSRVDSVMNALNEGQISLNDAIDKVYAYSYEGDNCIQACQDLLVKPKTAKDVLLILKNCASHGHNVLIGAQAIKASHSLTQRKIRKLADEVIVSHEANYEYREAV